MLSKAATFPIVQSFSICIETVIANLGTFALNEHKLSDSLEGSIGRTACGK